MYHSRNRAPHHCKEMKQCCKSVLQWCEAILQPCNAQCNGARPIYTTARGFCDDARLYCIEKTPLLHFFCSLCHIFAIFATNMGKTTLK